MANPSEPKIRHLEMIQGIINRMAGNLFYLKGWSVTLVAGLFALAAKDAMPTYIIIAYFPVVVFWILDGYFLSQERLFRALYDHVRVLDEDKIDFSMDTRQFKQNPRNGWMCSMGSPTLLWFYGILVAMMGAIMYLIN